MNIKTVAVVGYVLLVLGVAAVVAEPHNARQGIPISGAILIAGAAIADAINQR